MNFTRAPGNVDRRFFGRLGLHPTAGMWDQVSFAVLVNEEPLVRAAPVNPICFLGNLNVYCRSSNPNGDV